jgi:hypothetical protein
MGQIKHILVLLVILSVFSCTRNKSDIQPSVSVYENPLEAQNNFTENTNPSQIKKYSSTWTDAVADISFLAKMQDLEDVYIDGNWVLTDITPLSTLTKLKRITLISTPNIQSIEPLSNLVNLEYLFLDYIKTSDCAALVNLKKLKELKLRATPITSLLYISSLTELERLTLFIPNENIDTHRLGRLVNLKYLRLTGDGNRIDLTALSSLKNLEEIDLNHFIDLDVRPLQSLPRLKYINLYRSTVSISGIMGLPDNKTIEALGLPTNFGELPKDFYDKLDAADIRWGAEDGR